MYIDRFWRRDDPQWPSGYYDTQGFRYDTGEDFIRCAILQLCGCGEYAPAMLYVRRVLSGLERDRNPFRSLGERYVVLNYLAHIGLVAHDEDMRETQLTQLGEFILGDLNHLYPQTKAA